MQSNAARIEVNAGNVITLEVGVPPAFIELDLRDLPRVGEAGDTLRVDVRILRLDPGTVMRGVALAHVEEVMAGIAWAARERTGDALVMMGQMRALSTEAQAREARGRDGQDALRGALVEPIARIGAGMDTLREDARRRDAEAGEARSALAIELQDGQGRQLEALDALAARLERIEAELRVLRHGMENVFWRRWLRRLRGDPR